MPFDRSQYPADWVEFSRRIRFERARERCECTGECGHGVEDHDWTSGPVGRRVCTAYVTCPTEDDPENEERCECTGGWKPKTEVTR